MEQKNLFRGRKRLADRIAVQLGERKSIALVGLPKIGKQAILAQTLARVRTDAEAHGVQLVILETNLALAETVESYWRDIVLRLADELETRGIEPNTLMRKQRMFFEAHEEPLDFTITRNHVAAFLKGVDKTGCWVLLIIHEFDIAAELFEGKRYYYEYLRQIIHENHMSMVLLSRQLVKRIETNAYGQSTLFSVFEQVPVGEYDDEDMADYRAYLLGRGIVPSDDAWKEIAFTAGRNPYLLDMIADGLIGRPSAESADVLAVERERAADIVSYFDHLVKFMKKDKLLPTVMKMVVGPKYGLDREDERLIDEMGYLSAVNTNQHVQVVSEGFCEHLRYCKIDQDPWAELSVTIQALQILIEQRLPDLLGEHPASPEEFNAMLERHRLLQEPYYKTYVQNAWTFYHVHDTLVSVSSVHAWQEEFLRPHWDGPNGFGEAFHALRYDEWEEYFNQISFARNPLAHNNPERLTEGDIRATNLACERIQKAIGVRQENGVYYLGGTKLTVG